jgi:hypothetical protein
MLAAIRSAQEAQLKLHHVEIEWQTKAITHFIASTIEDDKGRAEMVKAAGNLSISGDKKSDPTSTTRADTTAKQEEHTLEWYMENGNVEGALEKNSKNRGTPFGM